MTTVISWRAHSTDSVRARFSRPARAASACSPGARRGREVDDPPAATGGQKREVDDRAGRVPGDVQARAQPPADANRPRRPRPACRCRPARRRRSRRRRSIAASSTASVARMGRHARPSCSHAAPTARPSDSATPIQRRRVRSHDQDRGLVQHARAKQLGGDRRHRPTGYLAVRRAGSGTASLTAMAAFDAARLTPPVERASRTSPRFERRPAFKASRERSPEAPRRRDHATRNRAPTPPGQTTGPSGSGR